MDGDDIDNGILDLFTSLDEEVARLNDNVVALSKQLDNGVQVGGGGGSGQGGNVEMGSMGIPRKKVSVDMSALVEPDDKAQEVEKMPFNGFVDGVIGGWPDGADLSVGMRIEDNEEGNIYFPSGDDDYASYNDFTHRFPVTFPVEKGDEIAALYKNNKSQNAIAVNTTLEVFKVLPHEDIEEVVARLS